MSESGRGRNGMVSWRWGLALAMVLGGLVALASLRRGAETRAGLEPEPSARADGARLRVAEASSEASRVPQEPAPEPRPLEAAPTASPPDSGVVTFLVRHDGVPRAGVEIRDGDPGAGLEPSPVWSRGEFEGLFEGDPPATDVVRTDGVGRARWSGLSGGPRAFWLRAPGVTRQRILLDAEREEVRVELGSAALEGFVFEEDGRPAGNVQLLALQHSTGEDALVWSSARTDRDGAYALEGLAGGDTHVVSLSVIERWSGDPGPLRLAVGERRRIDFGSPLGCARVTGRLRFPDGAPVEDSQRLVFAGPYTSLSWTSQEDGFALDLPLGPYRVHLGEAEGAELLAFELTGERDLDLALPGIVVRGPLRYVGTRHPRASGPEREVVLELLDADGTPCKQKPMRGERSWAFVGLAPGRYTLATRPWPIAGAPDGRLALELDGSLQERLVTLEITDP